MSGASAASRCIPCRCLCLGTLSQTTRTLPRRRTMRHASHSLRTELRTCSAGCQSGGGAWDSLRDACLHRAPERHGRRACGGGESSVASVVCAFFLVRALARRWRVFL